MHRPCRTS